jgi:hypothetical protein
MGAAVREQRRKVARFLEERAGAPRHGLAFQLRRFQSAVTRAEEPEEGNGGNGFEDGLDDGKSDSTSPRPPATS